MPPTEPNNWEERYAENQTPWDTGKPSAELANLIRSGRVPAGRALELGCGRGTNSLFLAEQGFRVTAVDVSPTAIERAKRTAVERGLEIDFRAADLTVSADLGDPFDFLFDRGVYHCVRRVDVAPFLRALEGASREGTLYLCLCGNAREPQEPGPPVVTEEELRAEIGSLFEILDLHEFRFDESPHLAGRPLGWSVLSRRRATSSAG